MMVNALPTRWVVGLAIGAWVIAILLPLLSDGPHVAGISGFFTGLGVGLMIVAAAVAWRRRNEPEGT